MPPMFVVLLPFIVAFCLATWQYRELDPARRILNAPFGLLAGCITVLAAYPIYAQLWPGDSRLAWALVAIGAVWFVLALWVGQRVRQRRAD